MDMLKYFFWFAVSLTIGFWPFWYLRSEKRLTEAELAYISPKFNGIATFSNNFLSWGSFTILVISAITISNVLNHYVLKGGGTIGGPFIVSFVMGLSLGIFALLKGVYPTMKSGLFFYNQDSKIRNVATLQILFAILSIAILVAVAYIW